MYVYCVVGYHVTLLLTTQKTLDNELRLHFEVVRNAISNDVHSTTPLILIRRSCSYTEASSSIGHEKLFVY